METFITVIHIIACVLIVLVVLIQSGKGAEISASFAGSSQTVFGSAGGANFFTRLTSTLAAIFMLTSLGLTYVHSQSKTSVFEGAPVSTAPAKAGKKDAKAKSEKKPTSANKKEGTSKKK